MGSFTIFHFKQILGFYRHIHLNIRYQIHVKIKLVIHICDNFKNKYFCFIKSFKILCNNPGKSSTIYHQSDNSVRIKNDK